MGTPPQWEGALSRGGGVIRRLWGDMMPTVLREDGYRFFFYSDEGTPREPPHVHVRQGWSEAKFWLGSSVSLVYNEGFDARTLNQLQKLVELHQDELERAWNEYFA